MHCLVTMSIDFCFVYQMSMIQFTHHLMDGPKEQIPAMNRVKQILREANFTNRVFPMCIGYASWETDEVSPVDIAFYNC